MDSHIQSVITIVISIASSSIVSSFLAHYIWNAQKKKEFKWDYKKYILEQRKIVYSKIEHALKDSYSLVTVNDKKIALPFYEYEDFTNFRKELFAIRANPFWLSEKLSEALTRLINITYFKDLAMQVDRNDFLHTKAVELRQEFRSKINDIHTIYFNDLLCLDNIEKHIKEKTEAKKRENKFTRLRKKIAGKLLKINEQNDVPS